MNRKLAAALALTIAGAHYEENNRLTLSRYSVSSPRVPQGFDGFSIVHLSDLHNHCFGLGQKRLLRRIEELSPDMVCITGDLMDKRRCQKIQELTPALALCEGLLRYAPVLYVPGNHEAAWPGYPLLRQALAAMGVTILEDRAVRFYRGEGCLYVAGLRDPSFTCENPASFREGIFRLCKESEGDFTLLLSHRPEALQEYGAAGADLVLAGHAHGGQFRLPGLGPVWVPNQGFFPPLAQGMHHFGNTNMVVSRGLGNSLFPQRLLNWPEIVFITLNRRECSPSKETGKK